MLKQIKYNFPVYYDGEGGEEMRLSNENAVESVSSLKARGMLFLQEAAHR